MKIETIYVILDILGHSTVVKGPGLEQVDLNQLIADGWRPVRETSFGNANQILICLERERKLR